VGRKIAIRSPPIKALRPIPFQRRNAPTRQFLNVNPDIFGIFVSERVRCDLRQRSHRVTVRFLKVGIAKSVLEGRFEPITNSRAGGSRSGRHNHELQEGRARPMRDRDKRGRGARFELESLARVLRPFIRRRRSLMQEMALLLTSKDLGACLSMEEAINAVEAALTERSAGSAVSPPRTVWEVPPSALTITPGGFQKLGVLGFRVYVRGERQDQLTAVWNLKAGRLEGLIVGPELGAIRTGAIGGVAYKWMAPRDTRRVGVIGAGSQSRTQLLALRVVRPMIEEVRIYRRDAGRREAVAREWSDEMKLRVRPVGTAREAVSDADVVVLATDSSTPVIETGWLRPGTHVSSLGPKYRERSEIDLSLVEGSDLLACDFPDQYLREEDFIAHDSPSLSRMWDLAELVASAPERKPELRTVFLSHGLAGTEVAVAHRALSNAAERGIGTTIPLGD
jgi:ornithine cyclodeaminase/alanine dehydrogenase-like protein (mu-crystallin family)